MEWKESNRTLTKRFVCSDFKEALGLVGKIGEIAEELNHHPDICFGWGFVEVRLTSHDKGGVTDRDRKLAAAIDSVL